MEENEKRVLVLPLCRVFADQIIAGKKMRDYRSGDSLFYARRMFHVTQNKKGEFVLGDVKFFDTVRFEPRHHQWFLECEVKCIEDVKVTERIYEVIKDEVICEVGDQLFVVHLGKVLATNLPKVEAGE